MMLERHRALFARLDAHQRAALLRRQRIAQAADAGREIARREPAGVEMLVELPVGRREHDAVLPVEPPEILVAVDTTAANSRGR